MMDINVVLIDDHPVVLAGIRALLKNAPGVTVGAEAGSGKAGLLAIAEVRPQIVVLDISLPDMRGLELAGRIGNEFPQARTIALTVHEDRAYVQPLLAAGVRGYVLKRSASEHLLQAVHTVMEGGIYLDPAIGDRIFSPEKEAQPSAIGPSVLSPREEEVMRLLAQGFSNKEVAGDLDVSVKTIETHKARACEKLGLRSRSGIVRFGAAHGWLDMPEER